MSSMIINFFSARQLYFSSVLYVLPLPRSPYLRYPRSSTKKIKKELMKLEHAGRNGGGRNGGRTGPRVLISLFLFDFFST